MYSYDSAAALDFDSLGPQDVVFAIGNIAADGRELMARVREEGKLHV